jgi:peroxiredoxin
VNMDPQTVIGFAVALLWIVTAILVILVLAALRHLAFLYEKLDPFFKFQAQPSNLRVNEPLPHITLRDATATPVPFELVAGASLVLVAQTACRPCSELLTRTRNELANAARASSRRPVVIVPGLENAAAKVRADYQLDDEIPVLADVEGATARVWGVYATPTALLLDDSGWLRKVISMVTAEQLQQALHEPGTTGPEPVPLQITTHAHLQ